MLGLDGRLAPLIAEFLRQREAFPQDRAVIDPMLISMLRYQCAAARPQIRESPITDLAAFSPIASHGLRSVHCNDVETDAGVLLHYDASTGRWVERK